MHLSNSTRDWKPVYLTEGERAAIVARLLFDAEWQKGCGNTEKASDSYFLAGLVVFADARAEAAS